MHRGGRAGPRGGMGAMNPLWTWAVALLLYGVFSAWYHNWSGPLTPAEIDAYMARLDQTAGAPDPERQAAARAFLEADDGGEFFIGRELVHYALRDLARVDLLSLSVGQGAICLEIAETRIGCSNIRGENVSIQAGIRSCAEDSLFNLTGNIEPFLHKRA